MPGDYYCFVPRAYVMASAEIDAVLDSEISDGGQRAVLALPQEDRVENPHDPAEFFRTYAEAAEPGQLLAALEHFFRAQQRAVVWDVILHGHGSRYEVDRSGVDGLWPVIAGLGWDEIKGMLTLLEVEADINLCVISTCFCGRQTVQEIADCAKEHPISFMIMTSSGGWNV